MAERAAGLAKEGRQPRLAVVTANDDGGSAAYVRSITNAAAREGIACDVARTTTAAGITATLAQLADDPEVHGIVLQTPLPEGANLADLAGAIPLAKDVDGASPESIGRLVAGLPAFAPATAEAVLRLLDHYGVELRGRHAVVVGRSVVVGKPVAHLLLDRHATVTICHSRTADLPAITRQADVLVAAVGRPGLIGPGHVSPGTTVIDVGTNATPDGGLAGDVDPAVADVAAALTPVPGGVGPVTTALLLSHVVRAAAAPGTDVRVCRFYCRCPADLVETNIMTGLSSFCPHSQGFTGSEQSERRGFGDPSYWDSQAATFDNDADHGLRDPRVRDAWRRLLLSHLPTAPAAIADIGCGTGSLSVLLTAEGYAVTGLDFAPAMIRAARAKARAAGVSARFVLSDAAAPALPPVSFDVVLARHVLWAMPDIDRSLAVWLRSAARGNPRAR